MATIKEYEDVLEISPNPNEWEQRVLEQIARELLLMEGSDWSFLLYTEQAKEYANQRFHHHHQRFLKLIWAAKDFNDKNRITLKELEEIEGSDKDLKKKEDKILDEAKKSVTKIAKGMTKNLKAMGESLADANAIVWEQEKEANTMSECPVCHKGKLRIMYGKRFSRYFVSCDAFPDCKTTYSLPPRGMMKPLRDKEGNLEMCDECGFPKVIAFKKGGAPWRFCFNPECSTNEEAMKKKAEFKVKLASGEIEIIDGKIVDHTKKNKSKKKTTKKKTKKKQKLE